MTRQLATTDVTGDGRYRVQALSRQTSCRMGFTGQWLVVSLLSLMGGPLYAQTCPANLAPKAAPDSRYAVSTPDLFGHPNDKVVTDMQTGLIWKQCSEGLSGGTCGVGTLSGMAWTNALLAASSAGHAGFSDWRLPDLTELQSLVETSCYTLAINTTIFPGTGSDRYWSSTAYALSPGAVWVVNFYYGNISNAATADSSVQVLLVRGGQLLDKFTTDQIFGYGFE